VPSSPCVRAPTPTVALQQPRPTVGAVGARLWRAAGPAPAPRPSQPLPRRSAASRDRPGPRANPIQAIPAPRPAGSACMRAAPPAAPPLPIGRRQRCAASRIPAMDNWGGSTHRSFERRPRTSRRSGHRDSRSPGSTARSRDRPWLRIIVQERGDLRTRKSDSSVEPETYLGRVALAGSSCGTPPGFAFEMDPHG
jgi:hypothetical protein